MFREFLKSKIHRAVITQADLEYEGSLTIDQELMDAAGIAKYEKIDVYNISNGQRFSTYAIPGGRGSGTIGLNGAAGRLGTLGVTRQSTMAILTLRLVSVIMQKRVISLAVPAVVFTAIKGGMALVDLSTPS